MPVDIVSSAMYTQEQVEEIAKRAAELAVRQALSVPCYSLSSPLQTGYRQKFMNDIHMNLIARTIRV